MSAALLLHLHPDGRWRVLDSDGAELAATGGRAAAVSWAIAYLHDHGGGDYRMRMANGALAAPVPVVGRTGVAEPPPTGLTPTAVRRPPTLPLPPPSPQPTATPARTPMVAEPARGKADWQGPVKDLGKLADQMMGRHDQPDPNADISGIEITSTNKTVKLINTHVSVFAAWSALVAFVFAGGTLSGIITPALHATSSKAVVGSYVTFGNAFLATVSLSVCTALVWFFVRSGKVRSYGAAAALVIGCLVVIFVCYQAGLYGPSPATVAAAVSAAPGAPPSKLGTLFEQFLAFYGLSAFLLGLGAGAVAGNIGYHIDQAEAGPVQLR